MWKVWRTFRITDFPNVGGLHVAEEECSSTLLIVSMYALDANDMPAV
jgi:hypothetical protein